MYTVAVDYTVQAGNGWELLRAKNRREAVEIAHAEVKADKGVYAASIIRARKIKEQIVGAKTWVEYQGKRIAICRWGRNDDGSISISYNDTMIQGVDGEKTLSDEHDSPWMLSGWEHGQLFLG